MRDFVLFKFSRIILIVFLIVSTLIPSITEASYALDNGNSRKVAVYGQKPVDVKIKKNNNNVKIVETFDGTNYYRSTYYKKTKQLITQTLNKKGIVINSTFAARNRQICLDIVG